MTPAKNILEKQTIQRVENTPNVLPEFIPNSHKGQDHVISTGHQMTNSVEFLIIVIVIFFNYSQVLKFGAPSSIIRMP